MVGAHIRVLKDGRWIHAVDCGDETVLHLVEETPPPRVRRAYRPEFVAGAAAVEVVLHRERTFPAKEIVRRAYSRASDPALAAMFRDSEAFADWCTTGRLAGSRNVALDVPGIAPPPASDTPAPAPKARPAPAAAKAAAPQAARKKAAPKASPKVPAKAKVKARAKPRLKAAARKPAAAARKPAAAARKAKAAPRRAKAPAKRGAKASRKGRR
jgi:hypothetical protein